MNKIVFIGIKCNIFLWILEIIVPNALPPDLHKTSAVVLRSIFSWKITSRYWYWFTYCKPSFPILNLNLLLGMMAHNLNRPCASMFILQIVLYVRIGFLWTFQRISLHAKDHFWFVVSLESLTNLFMLRFMRVYFDWKVLFCKVIIYFYGASFFCVVEIPGSGLLGCYMDTLINFVWIFRVFVLSLSCIRYNIDSF